LIEENGDFLNCLILHRLLAIRAFYCEAMDLAGQCFITSDGV
jgi:hypothetical protein